MPDQPIPPAPAAADPGQPKPAEPGPPEPSNIAASILPQRQRDAARHPADKAQAPDSVENAPPDDDP